MITVTFALSAESSAFRERLRERETRAADGTEIVAGRISGKPIEILHTGVGREIAAARLRHYFDRNRPALLIASGFAGATRSNYRVGDLIVASNFSNTDLVSTARRVLREQNVHTGTLFTASTLIDSMNEREDIWHSHEALAVDMETEAIHEVCTKRNIPMLSLRVLSDTPRHPFPLPPEVLFDLARQRVPYFRLLGKLIAQPATIPKLLNFQRQITQARRTLTMALVKLLQSPI